MRAAIGVSICTATLTLTSPARASPERTPGELFDRGEAKLAAGDRPGGISDLMQAYAGYDDPLVHRSERGDLVGIVRSELMSLYKETSDPAHLCRIRALLVVHVEGLLAALGPDAATGSTALLREAGELLRTLHPMTRCACDVGRAAQRPPFLGLDDPVRIPMPTPASPPPATAALRPSPRLVAGSVLTGASVGLGGLLAVAVRAYAVDYAALRRIADAAESGGPLPVDDEVDRRGSAARVARGVSIALGVAAVATLASGVALLVTHERRAPSRRRCSLRGSALACNLPF